MRAKESPKFPAPGSDDIVQLWKRDASAKYRNIASDFMCHGPPKLLSGGILADDMGLGKTLQIISLVLTGGPGATLIVAPVSVMSNWQQQASRHVKTEHAPKVFIFHGTSKATAAGLMKYDIVVTSYGKLQREMDKGINKVLLAPEAKWRRVVLDEGHTIRNARTKIALAACELNAQSRWVLSGTPMCVLLPVHPDCQANVIAASIPSKIYTRWSSSSKSLVALNKPRSSMPKSRGRLLLVLTPRRRSYER
jgi:SWI/SNF-related matrix-associated actin-dependent regulator of chromatin subfamily A3